MCGPANWPSRTIRATWMSSLPLNVPAVRIVVAPQARYAFGDASGSDMYDGASASGSRNRRCSCIITSPGIDRAALAVDHDVRSGPGARFGRADPDDLAVAHQDRLAGRGWRTGTVDHAHVVDTDRRRVVDDVLLHALMKIRGSLRVNSDRRPRKRERQRRGDENPAGAAQRLERRRMDKRHGYSQSSMIKHWQR